ncbi:hypothetical protein [Bacillus gaemokensis]|uniref:Uncharacterized protein n=1 Tax=Bacillus gaemokensis TaxID=574375 RepID=A0A073KD20_9BACI|nr:hypothetical protein [Bacillus gaemokensis]KEK24411.1 hypothetical protein BAGA_27100 [Bacillus gaemokensis]KYG38386.1 hypothetical protein AZF08_18830 [Bacillus gaemokensis]
MHIVNNLDSTHFDQLRNLVNGADTLHIISPFLSESKEFYDDLFELLNNEGVKNIFLTTTLDDYSTDLFRKANALYLFGIGCLALNI